MKKFLLISLFLFSSLIKAQQWFPAGSGTGREITALVEYQGKLVIGGWFSSPGNYIATWDGNNYNTLGSGFSGFGSNFVTALCVYNGDLYAGGYFNFSGSTPVSSIAKWDGTSWTALETGIKSIAGAGFVFSLQEYNNELYVGGLFDTAGSVPAANIAKWDGNTWSSVGGTGTNPGGLIYPMVVHNNELYAAGSFSTIGGVTAGDIAKWNGLSWSALSTDTIDGGNPFSLVSDGTDLFMGGAFTTINSTPVNYVARWDGNSWNTMGAGADKKIVALYNHDGVLYAGGDFNYMDGIEVNHIAKWSASAWSAMDPTGMDTSVFAISAYRWDLFAGGFFTTASGSPANYLAWWSVPIGIDNKGSMAQQATFFPNPFSSNATINIPASYGDLNDISVVLYDLTGRAVQTISNPGSYSVMVDRSGMAAGLYFYHVMNGNEVLASDKFTIE